MSTKRDAELVQFLETVVNLNALDRMTTDLDNELKDSQAVMNEMKMMIDAFPVKGETLSSEPDSNGLGDEGWSNLIAGTPKLIMPDMDPCFDVDLDDVINTMRSFVEDLKKSCTHSEMETREKIDTKQFEGVQLEQYASTLDDFCKRLATLKLIKKTETNSRDADLEAKLSVLCDDVNKFTKMIEAKTTLSETNQNWTPMQIQNTNSLDYDSILDKLLSDINSVSYLLLTKK